MRLMSCYFGNIPSYFDLFLLTCGTNSDVSFVIFCDFDSSSLQLPDNVELIEISIQEFNDLASQKLDLNIKVSDPYKLNDFKPAYGIIFDDYINGFDFWGYIDIDLVFGNLRKVLSDDVLSQYDVISVRKEFTSGFFCLYRNVPHVNNLFRSSADHVRILENGDHFCFDECNFAYEELFAGKSILDVPTDVQSMTYVVRRAQQQGLIRARFETIVEEFDPRLQWKNGDLTSVDTRKEFLLFHLINVKNSDLFKILPVSSSSRRLHILSSGISSNAYHRFSLKVRYFTTIIGFYTGIWAWRAGALFSTKSTDDWGQFVGSYRLKNSKLYFRVFASDDIYVELPGGASMKLLRVKDKTFISYGQWLGRNLHFVIDFSSKADRARVNYLANCVSFDRVA